jgi:hypothetical protein
MELILENVRCFAGEHTVRIRPLTILVGENSSGKSTFLAALSAVCDPVGFPMQPSFNEPQLVELDRKGRARAVSGALVDEETAALRASGLCRSNDVHVIALARVGRVGLLCACDNALKRDFKTKALIDRPRGKVYNRKSHKELLREFCSSVGPRSARRRHR